MRASCFIAVAVLALAGPAEELFGEARAVRDKMTAKLIHRDIEGAPR